MPHRHLNTLQFAFKVKKKKKKKKKKYTQPNPYQLIPTNSMTYINWPSEELREKKKKKIIAGKKVILILIPANDWWDGP